jgi:hypothetical protein
LAKLNGVALCPDSQAASGNCPTASQVGSAKVASGPGPSPLWLPQAGREPISLFLAGPYKGAPYSFVVRAPAQAGPFDLGTVVVRQAIFVDPETAQVTVKSDPLPQILEGVPVTYRTIYAAIDRPEFTVNPTSCEVKAYPKGSYANIARAQVTLPASEFIDQAHIGNPCTRPVFAEEKCPKISILGKAKVWTPLLEQPEEGNVYFRSNGGERELPDIVVALRGQIPLNLVGFVDSQHQKGSEISRLRTTFATVPDAPVTKFVLELKGGKEGLLVNSGNLCKVPNKAIVKLSAQNGRVYNTQPAVKNGCGAKKSKKTSKP